MPSRGDKLLAALKQTAPVPEEKQARPQRTVQSQVLYSYSESVDLPPEAADLPDDVQDMARQFISTKRRIGRDLLEASRLIAEARARTEQGQWLLFLRVTHTSPDVGEYLQNIWHRASAHLGFREAIERGWLSEGAARRMARDSVPNDTIDAILQLPEPPTVRLIEQKLREQRSTVRHQEASPEDQIPTRVGISNTLPFSTDVKPLTDADRSLVDQLRICLAPYTEASTGLAIADRQLLQMLADELNEILEVHR